MVWIDYLALFYIRQLIWVNSCKLHWLCHDDCITKHRIWYNYLRQQLFLLATLLKKLLTYFDEIFRTARQWYKEQLVKFGGDPAHLSDAVHGNVKCCISDNAIWGYWATSKATRSNWVTWNGASRVTWPSYSAAAFTINNFATGQPFFSSYLLKCVWLTDFDEICRIARQWYKEQCHIWVMSCLGGGLPSLGVFLV